MDTIKSNVPQPSRVSEACIDGDSNEADARTKQAPVARYSQAIRDSFTLAERNKDLPLSFQIENHLERLRDLAGDKGHVLAILVTADRERFDAIQLCGPHRQHESDGIASKMQTHPRWSLMIQHFSETNSIWNGR